jgi:hypothetical protein
VISAPAPVYRARRAEELHAGRTGAGLLLGAEAGGGRRDALVRARLTRRAVQGPAAVIFAPRAQPSAFASGRRSVMSIA